MAEQPAFLITVMAGATAIRTYRGSNSKRSTGDDNEQERQEMKRGKFRRFTTGLAVLFAGFVLKEEWNPWYPE